MVAVDRADEGRRGDPGVGVRSGGDLGRCRPERHRHPRVAHAPQPNRCRGPGIDRQAWGEHGHRAVAGRHRDGPDDHQARRSRPRPIRPRTILRVRRPRSRGPRAASPATRAMAGRNRPSSGDTKRAARRPGPPISTGTTTGQRTTGTSTKASTTRASERPAAMTPTHHRRHDELLGDVDDSPRRRGSSTADTTTDRRSCRAVRRRSCSRGSRRAAGCSSPSRRR